MTSTDEQTKQRMAVLQRTMAEAVARLMWPAAEES